MSWIGLDVGGANLKIAWPDRPATEHPFPMWSAKEELVNVLTGWLAAAPMDWSVAVTMTGELADCFASKAEGVAFIVDAVCQSAGRRLVRFYRTDGSWCEPATAIADPLSVAASNWHALASFAATGLPTRSGFLVDIGSTTTDVIPIVDGQPAIANQTDLDRLKNRQLTYTGASRSSLAGVLSKVEIDGCSVELANEHFSTINDAYLWLGKVPERPNGRNTADGRAETRSNAAQRLARMVCADASELADESITQLAVAASNANTNRIAAAIDSVVAQFSEGDAGIPLSFVISGSGAWLVEEALDVFWKARQANERRDQAFVRLADQIGMANATAGAAHAVRVLAEKSVNARKRPG